ncbi:MAG TPA: hypothetical protein VFZ78_11175 [Flavisolibacter sp.]
MKNFRKAYGFLAGCAVLLLIGCYKDKTVYFDTAGNITETVSFAGDIIPIFNNSCNVSGCHNAGGKAPDLSPANAYNSLVNGSYFNTSDPEASEIYLWMTGKRGTPMPLSGVNRDYNAYILAWIKQGALNN